MWWVTLLLSVSESLGAKRFEVVDTNNKRTPLVQIAYMD